MALLPFSDLGEYFVMLFGADAVCEFSAKIFGAPKSRTKVEPYLNVFSIFGMGVSRHHCTISDNEDISKRFLCTIERCLSSAGLLKDAHFENREKDGDNSGIQYFKVHSAAKDSLSWTFNSSCIR